MAERTLVEFDDDGPDEQGRRHFSLFWKESDGKLRAQDFFSQPERYDCDSLEVLKPEPGEHSCDAAARVLGAKRRGWRG